MRKRTADRLRQDERGVTLVEFAMIAPALCMILLALFDLGHRAYVGSIVQGAMHEAARMATVGGVTLEAIDTHVKGRLAALSNNATIVTSTRSYAEFSDVGVPELITSDTAPIGEYNPGDCFEDANGNGVYDLDRGRDGFGGAEDIVQYEVTMSFPRLFPITGFLGWSEVQTVSANTVLRNQPFAARSTGTPPEVCT